LSAGPQILLIYRRDGTTGYASYLVQGLRERFGAENVFTDIDSEGLAQDFAELFQSRLAQCDTAVVLIGDNWVADDDQREGRGLYDPADHTRIEVEAALGATWIRVVPALVGGVQMPEESQLPSAVGALTSLRAFEISGDGWYADVQALADSIGGVAPSTGVSLTVPTVAPSEFPIAGPEVPPSDSPQNPPKNPRSRTIGLLAVVVVIVLVVILVVLGINSSPGHQAGTDKGSAQSIISLVTSVPESVFAQVGLPSEVSNIPTKVTGHAPLSKSNLPEMLYVGAEYCPFCAAERWAMVMALSKFGTFSGLRITHSSVTDFAPNTATFTFARSSYKSKYVSFQPYEVASNSPAASTAKCNVNGYACLDIPPAAEANLFESLGGGSFPFIDFANMIVQVGAGFGDQPLVLAGLDASQIAQKLHDPGSPVAQAEDGSANYITAAICTMTGEAPSTVCSAPYVSSAQRHWGGS